MNKENEFLKDFVDLMFPDTYQTFFDKLCKVDDMNRKYFNDRFTIKEVINLARQI
jgi:hypothetical protein